MGDLLAEQYAASKGITVSSSDLTTAQTDLESTLDGEINQAVEQAESEGTLSYLPGRRPGRPSPERRC